MNERIGDETFRAICDEFRLSDLELAYRVLARAMCAGYGGCAELNLTVAGSSDTEATVYVSAESTFRWGNGWSEWGSRGVIVWHTSSNHHVRFEFSAEKYAHPVLDRVVIGTDESEVFYPTLRELCSVLVEEC